MTILSTNPLHLYRALLRESTYLFDPAARKWASQYIRTSFRHGVPKIQDGTGWKTVPHNAERPPSQHERHQLKRGRKFLVTLQRANQGYLRQLRNVLQWTYGRKGRLKRLLTAPLMQDNPKLATLPATESEPLQQQTVGKETSKYSKEWRPSGDFLTLLFDQGQLSSHLSIRRQIRLKPNIEEKNKWGRPMPPSRIKNTTRKWYARMAAALMPPSSEHEWERLKSIALRRHVFQVVPRRPTASKTMHGVDVVSVDSAANAIVSGIQETTSRKLARSIKNPHNLTPRFLSRFYGKHIFNHTPMAVPNPTGKGLISKWDDGRRNVLPAVKPNNVAQINALFG